MEEIKKPNGERSEKTNGIWMFNICEKIKIKK